MASVGEPEENGYAERLMRTIKEEVDLSEYGDFGDTLRGLGRSSRVEYVFRRPGDIADGEIYAQLGNPELESEQP